MTSLWNFISMHLDAFLLLNEIYLVPVLVLILGVLGAAWLWKRMTVRWFECIAWLLPGITYWYLWDVQRWEFAFPGKTMANLVEPFYLAVVVAVLFVGRLVLARWFPRPSPVPFVLFLVLSNISAVLVQVLTPGLPAS